VDDCKPLLLGGALYPVIQHSGLHISIVLLILMGFSYATREINPYLNKVGGVIENIHSTDVESPPPICFARLLKPSLRVCGDSQRPHVIGRESDSLKFDWLDFLARVAPIEPGWSMYSPSFASVPDWSRGCIRGV
jgi:hypothetical protein